MKSAAVLVLGLCLCRNAKPALIASAIALGLVTLAVWAHNTAQTAQEEIAHD